MLQTRMYINILQQSPDAKQTKFKNVVVHACASRQHVMMYDICWWMSQINPVALPTTDYDVISGCNGRREDAVALPVDSRTAANCNKPTTTTTKNSARREPASDNRKRKEKRKAADAKLTLETGSSEEVIKGSPQTILNVPQYTQESCSNDVTDIDNPATANKWVFLLFFSLWDNYRPMLALKRCRISPSH